VIRGPEARFHPHAEKKSTVRTPEARAIARETKYPPIGDRGISGQGMHTG
jgi:hypothetical protein